MCPLLRTLPLSQEEVLSTGQYVTLECAKLQFCSIAHPDVSQIRIALRDTHGLPIAFAQSEEVSVFVDLLFRKM